VFPSLIGRLKTVADTYGQPRLNEFPSLIGRLKTYVMKLADMQHEAVSIPYRKTKNCYNLAKIENSIRFPSLIGRLKT